MEGLLTRQAGSVSQRLRKSGLSGRTVTIKVRLHDFTTLNRSTTLPSPTDSGPTIARLARSLLTDLDTSGGVRLLGVGVSGLADWIQEDLFGEIDPEEDELPDESVVPSRDSARPGHRAWTSSTPRWAAAGCGARGAGWSPCASRPRTRRPGRCGRTPSDDPALSAWRPPEPADPA